MADITVDDVAAWLDRPVPSDAGELAVMQRVVDAVVQHIKRHYVDPTTFDPPESDADWKLAQTMMAARYWKRRSSPEGIIDVGELGPIRIGRVDADVAKLLERRWGFA